MKQYPSQIELLNNLEYDPNTGIVSWKSRRSRVRIGIEAGTLDNKGYRRIKFNARIYRTHILIWIMQTGLPPSKTIDHINRKKDDNRWCNLREATMTEQSYNRSLHYDSKSLITGVSWHKAARKWHAQIMVSRKKIHLGLYSSKNDAIEARKNAEIKYFGDFRCRNY
jgi:hypothetical protein